MNHWIVALPGTHLQGLRSAGAPTLEALASTDKTDLDTDEWRGWILYGPPDQALLELSLLSDEHSRLESLQRWSQHMVLAAQAKREWRHRLTLIHIHPDCRSEAPSAGLLNLQQALPELELQVRLERQTRQHPVPVELTTMAARCLMQSDPALLQAYLDLEAWADEPSQAPLAKEWRTAPSHGLILQTLSAALQSEKTTDQAQKTVTKLTQTLRRGQQERSQLQHTLEQLESELEHYMAEHLALNATTRRLEEQLLRARQLIKS